MTHTSLALVAGLMTHKGNFVSERSLGIAKTQRPI